MSAYSIVDLSQITKRSGALSMPKRGGLAKLDIKGEEEIVAWTGGIIFDANGTIVTLKTYVAWDPTKGYKEKEVAADGKRKKSTRKEFTPL